MGRIFSSQKGKDVGISEKNRPELYGIAVRVQEIADSIGVDTGWGDAARPAKEDVVSTEQEYQLGGVYFYTENNILEVWIYSGQQLHKFPILSDINGVRVVTQVLTIAGLISPQPAIRMMDNQKCLAWDGLTDVHMRRKES